MQKNWDLSGIFASSDDAIFEGKRVLKCCKEFNSKYLGKLLQMKNQNTLLPCIQEYAKLSADICKLDSYAYLLNSTHLNNPKYGKFFQNISDLTDECKKTLLFLPLEIRTHFTLDDFHDVNDMGVLSWIKKCLRLKPHTIKPEQELILSDMSSLETYWIRLYNETCAKLKVNIDGKEYNEGEVYELFTGKDEAIRNVAQKKVMEWFASRIDKFALIYNALIKSRQTEANWHNYTYPEHLANLSNDIVKEDLDNLVETLVKFNFISNRYYALKAKILGKNKISYVDRLAPYPFDTESKKYTIEEAKEIILSAFNEFSEQFASVAKTAFDNNLIDYYPYEGKASGAYCMEMPVDNPSFVFTNFTGSIGDVYTLAHELGHFVHETVCKKYGELGREKSCAQAETASVFAEYIVFNALLNEVKNPQEKFVLLASHIEDMIATVFRQIAFHRFEHQAHTLRREEGELSAQRLNDIFLNCMQDYLGPAVDTTGVESLWCSIPHFFEYQFYVYSYSFSACVVNSLYEVYLSENTDKSEFAVKYMEMLTESGIENYRDALKRFNIDAASPDFWANAIGYIEHELKTLEKLAIEIS